MLTSKTDATNIKINITNENIVCLNISNFIFSLLLSFVIDLYNFIPLTAIANIAGINNILGNKKFTNEKIVPLVIPSMVTDTAIVYPKQKPLYNTIPNTIGMPITVVPKNHKDTANIIFCITLVFNRLRLFNFSMFFICSIKWFK